MYRAIFFLYFTVLTISIFGQDLGPVVGNLRGSYKGIEYQIRFHRLASTAIRDFEGIQVYYREWGYTNITNTLTGRAMDADVDNAITMTKRPVDGEVTDFYTLYSEYKDLILWAVIINGRQTWTAWRRS